MQINPLVGQPGIQSFGSSPQLRAGRRADGIVTELKPRYYEEAYNGNLFYAANIAAQAVSVGLATTYTGLLLYNPAGSGKNLIPTKVGITLTAAPAATANIGLIGGYLQAGVTTHTTPLLPRSTLLGTGQNGVGGADSAATLPATPVWLTQLMGGFTAAALPGVGPALIDLEGTFVIPPGGFIGIGALAAVTGMFSMNWIEELI